MKHFKISNLEIESVLKKFELLSIKTTTFWVNQCSKGDFSGLQFDGRINGRHEEFYDIYPDIEIEARNYAIIKASEKSSAFTVYDLAVYITELYEKETGENLITLVRSESSCKRDLIRWGAYLGKNSNRPYFEGHERVDVVEHRERFVGYFASREHFYYQIESDQNDKEKCDWINPMRKEDDVCFKKTVLLSHDEANNRRGETSKRKWFFPGKEPLYQKGKMQSVMQSWFIMQHPSGPFLQLTEEEYEKCCKKYPELKENENFYYEREASAQIILNGQNYFDNETILEEFERLFKIIQFLEALKDHNVEILVDNATTHTTKKYSLNQFRKNEGYDCPVDELEWFDEKDNFKTLSCYYENENSELVSKGLFNIAKELNLIDKNLKSKDINLPELQEICKKHAAFKEVTKLEEMAAQYPNIKIIFVPKFHCELNPIEGIWAFSKNNVRRKNDFSSLANFIQLLDETKEIIQGHVLHKKLWRRFWKTVKAYHAGDSCIEVLKKNFSLKCKDNIQEHRKIENTIL